MLKYGDVIGIILPSWVANRNDYVEVNVDEAYSYIDKINQILFEINIPL